jgi:WD40 repeat protein
VGLWDVATGKERSVLLGQWRAVLGVGVNRDGDAVATAGLDQMVRIWDLSGMKKDKK